MKCALIIGWNPTNKMGLKLKRAIESKYTVTNFDTNTEFRTKHVLRRGLAPMFDRIYPGGDPKVRLEEFLPYLKRGGAVCVVNCSASKDKQCSLMAALGYVYEKESKHFTYYNAPKSIELPKETEMVNEQKYSIIPLNIDEEVSLIDYNFLVTKLSCEKSADAFSRNYKRSLSKLYQYKKDLYKNILLKLNEEISDIAEKKKELVRSGLSEKEASELHPAHSELTGFKVIVKDITSKIRRLSMSIHEFDPAKEILAAIKDRTNGMTSMIGRAEVKDHISRQIYAFSKNYKIFTGMFNNYAFMGKAGSGKTQISKVMAHIYSSARILVRSTISIKSRADLVGQYIGHTAPKTRSALWNSLEGILLIDEAYELGSKKGDSKDYGNEAITEIVNFIDKYVGTCIIVVAGYEDELRDRFFGSNQGLERRFPLQFVLKPYSTEELCTILCRKLSDFSNIELDSNIKNTLYTLLYHTPSKFLVNSAGDMLNIASIISRASDSYTKGWNKTSSPTIIYKSFCTFVEQKGGTGVYSVLIEGLRTVNK